MGWPWLFHLFLLSLICLSVSSEESIELLNLCETSEDVLQASSQDSDLSLAISISYGDINGVSSNILMAETWLKTNVLAHYPAVRITTIVINLDLCNLGVKNNNYNHERKLNLVLPSLKNIYHSLKRWGLENDIKVSISFSLDCFPIHSLRHLKMAKYNLKPLLEFLQSVNSTYSLIPHSGFSHFSQQSLSLVSSHLDFMKNLGFLNLKKVNVLGIASKIRKLSEISEPPIMEADYPSLGGYAIKNPNFPPTGAPSKSPLPSPSPAPSPNSFNTLPPCKPIGHHGSPEAELEQAQKSWCVAKPSVPAQKLQQALEYACGEGGGDCEEILPTGKCYNPDSVVAHASYAFNSYWQKNKRNGGTCYFGGTAMLVNSDPISSISLFRGGYQTTIKKLNQTGSHSYQSQVSILGPVGYGPTTLPLRHSDLLL
ncbi:hypothetical protein AHAS_Ahas11G0115100 [Arachis hypogaea]